MLRIVASHGPEDGIPVAVEITRHRRESLRALPRRSSHLEVWAGRTF